MGNTPKYIISRPESVKHIAEEFRKKVKNEKKMKRAKNTEDKDAFVFAFCPIVSRAGTDIEAALNKIKNEYVNHPNKRVILIVLHHTFDPESIVSDSSKFVGSQVGLTVDCLFYEDQGLLKCKRNSKAFKDVAGFLKSQGTKGKEDQEGKDKGKNRQKGSTVVPK